MKVEKAFVINLARRYDRWETVRQVLEKSITCPLERFDAVDGRELVYDEALMRRINPWNIIGEGKVKSMGVIGCCLSHVGVWEKCTEPDKWYLVFEDDAVLINPHMKHLKIPRHIPSDAGILYLCDYYSKYSENGVHVTRERPCAEAYAIKGSCAKELFVFNKDNLGAADEHIKLYIQSQKDFQWYSLNPPVFRQKGMDTDIQRRDYMPITRFLPAFVINLDRRPDRMQQFKSRCPLPASRVSAVDDASLSEYSGDVFAKACVSRAGLRFSGEVGCFLSHAKVWKMMLDKHVPFVHVFEDDALFCEDYAAKLGVVLKALPHDFFVCYVGGRFDDGVVTGPDDTVVTVYDYSRPWRPLQDDRTTHSYIVSYQGARLLYDGMVQATQAVDHYMLKVFQERCLPVHSANPLLNWSPRVGDSDIR